MFKNIVFSGIMAILGSQAIAADGLFAQYDQSKSGGSAVVAKQLGQWQASAAYSQWSNSGKSLSGSLVQNAFTINESGTTFKVNVGVGAIDHRSDSEAASQGDAAVGVKLSAEVFRQVRTASVYVLTEYNTAFHTWLGVLQIKPVNSNFGMELTAVGDDRWYVGHKAAVTWRANNSPWTLRIGHQFTDQSNFIGISYNTF
jgi:hypothetical protein